MGGMGDMMGGMGGMPGMGGPPPPPPPPPPMQIATKTAKKLIKELWRCNAATQRVALPCMHIF